MLTKKIFFMNEKSRLLNIVDNFDNKEIIVAGDIMLDLTEEGHGSESPEDACFIIKNPETSFAPGGAGNVYSNILSLNGKPYLCGVIGKDNLSIVLLAELNCKLKKKYSTGELDGIVSIPDRKTTLKRRTFKRESHYRRQLVRVDNEEYTPIDKATAEKVINGLKEKAKEGTNFKIFSFSDYSKGFLTNESVEMLRSFCKEYGIRTIVDPKPSLQDPDKILKFVGCYGFKPNLKEAEYISGINFKGSKEKNNLNDIAKKSMDLLKPEGFLLITDGENGMHLFYPDGKFEYLPVVNKGALDITGAGDTSLAALSLSLAANASIIDAAKVANYAGSIAVKKKGTASVLKKELTDLIDDPGF